MKIYTSYSIKIKKYNNIFKDTVAIYREAVDFFIDVCMREWDGIATIGGDLLKQQYVERLCHETSKNTAPKYQRFDNRFYKFPSYPTGGLYDYQLADILTTHTISVGVNSFYLYAYAMNYNWATLCSRINSNLPCAMSVLNHPTYGDHFVVACGYTDIADYSTSKIYINTGWSSHGFVWIYQNYCDYLIPCV